MENSVGMAELDALQDLVCVTLRQHKYNRQQKITKITAKTELKKFELNLNPSITNNKLIPPNKHIHYNSLCPLTKQFTLIPLIYYVST